MLAAKNGMLSFIAGACYVCLCTCDRGFIAVLLTVAILLSVCILLCVLQTQFVTHFERLADRPNNTHGLTLWVGRGRERKKCSYSQNTNCTTFVSPFGSKN